MSALLATMVVLSTVRPSLPIDAVVGSAVKVILSALTGAELLTAAVTCASPARVPFRVIVALPELSVLLDGADKVPLSVAHLTARFGTALPLASFTIAV